MGGFEVNPEDNKVEWWAEVVEVVGIRGDGGGMEGGKDDVIIIAVTVIISANSILHLFLSLMQ